MRSGWQVLISTSYTQLLGSLLSPWLRYKVNQWAQRYTGIQFPDDYADQMLTFLVMTVTASVGIVHMVVLNRLQAPAQNPPADTK